MTPGSEFRYFIQKSLKYLINAKSIQGQMQLQRERKHIMMNVIVDFYQWTKMNYWIQLSMTWETMLNSLLLATAF